MYNTRADKIRDTTIENDAHRERRIEREHRRRTFRDRGRSATDWMRGGSRAQPATVRCEVRAAHDLERPGIARDNLSISRALHDYFPRVDKLNVAHLFLSLFFSLYIICNFIISRNYRFIKPRSVWLALNTTLTFLHDIYVLIMRTVRDYGIHISTPILGIMNIPT